MKSIIENIVQSYEAISPSQSFKIVKDNHIVNS